MNVTSGWSKWTGSGSEWDRVLLGFPDSNIYQSWGWGLHRAEFGWKVLPLAFVTNGSVTALAMTLLKTKLRSVTVCWVPGGPVGNIALSSATLISAVNEATSSHAIYVHINSMAPYSEKTSDILQVAGWTRPSRSLNTGKTLVYSSFDEGSDRRDLLSKNWKRNLTRGEQRNLTVTEWSDATGSNIAEVTNEMLDYKKLPGLAGPNETPDSLLGLFRNQILMTKCSDADGNTLAIRGVIKLGHKAFDMFAASTPAGRKEYASNLCLWKIIELCARDGVTYYDLSGADPINNPGVYNFKKGIGALDFEYQGEWVISRPRILGTFISRMIARRLRSE